MPSSSTVLETSKRVKEFCNGAASQQLYFIDKESKSKILYCPDRSPRVLDSLHCAQSPIGPLKKSFYWTFGSGSSNWRNQIKVLPPSTGGVSERGEWWLERSKGRWGIPWEMERASFTRLTFVPSPFCWHVQGIDKRLCSLAIKNPCND